MKKEKFSNLITIIFILVLILGTISLPFIPKLYDIFKDANVEKFSNQTIIYQIAFYSCFIICLLIILNLIKVFDATKKNKPFTKTVERSLNATAILFELLFFIIFIKSLFIPTILSIAIAFVCFISALSFYVLKEIISTAINYKNEIDYTV